MTIDNNDVFRPIIPYLNSIRALPKLSSIELSDTIYLYKLSSNIELRDKLIIHYLPLIPQLLVRYISSSIELSDLLQCANIKLIELIDLIPGSDVADVRAYIITSINNYLIDIIRHRNNII